MIKIFPKRGKEFKVLKKSNCPKFLRGFWQGEVFAEAKNKTSGILGELQIAKLLEIKYPAEVPKIVEGDFTSVRWIRG